MRAFHALQRRLPRVEGARLTTALRALGTAANQNEPTVKPVTPDFTTSIEVAGHKLSRPVRGSRGEGSKMREFGSLIPDTLAEMEEDMEFIENAAALRKMGQQKMTREEKIKRARALDNLGVPSFRDFIERQGGVQSVRKPAQVFQMNIGLYCNQACTHCHVESSPKRKENMSLEVMDRCLELIRNSPSIKIVDITGGAPELQPNFRYLVESLRDLDRDLTIIDRCNLTVLTEPGEEDLPDFLKKHKVRVIASLPCYSSKNVNLQRGKGVFARSIEGLQELNRIGYGREPSLGLDLVYNPIGPFLPPDQTQLQSKYKQQLKDDFDIEFNELYTVTNMPIKRFADFLYRRGELEAYLALLVRNFNPATVAGMMCTDHVNVSWDGRVYDCDFNQQLEIPSGMEVEKSDAWKRRFRGQTVFDLDKCEDLLRTPIAHDSHCFGCTAGNGSS